jgi:hypothetical protein
LSLMLGLCLGTCSSRYSISSGGSTKSGTSRLRVTPVMGGTGLSLDLPMKVTPAARAPQLMQWPIMVSDPANLEAASISLIPTHRVLWRDALESQASSRAAAVKFLLPSLTTTSGQLTTSALPSALLYHTSLLGCSRKATARIRLI